MCALISFNVYGTFRSCLDVYTFWKCGRARLDKFIVASKFENQNCTVVLKYNFATVTMTNKKYY